MAETAESLWIFAYGSLMWHPGFPVAERHRATLEGYHRALCIWSHHHRGTPERPGLVFGLDHGGSCTGVAYRVAPDDAEAAIAYVRERELVTNVYREIVTPARLADGRTVPAVAYVADRDHVQYAGRMAADEVRRTVLAANGLSGPNLAYVLNTQAHLLDLGVEDRDLAALCQTLPQADGPLPR